MARSLPFQSNVRPRANEEDESEDGYDRFEDGVEQFPEDNDLEASDEETSDGQSSSHRIGNNGGENDEDEEGSEDGAEVQDQISRTSFGALKQAQDALSKKRKRGSDSNQDQEEKLAALRSRLNDLRKTSKTQQRKNESSRNGRVPASNKRIQDPDSDQENSDSDSAPSEEGAPSKSRSSKHAPATQSSKYQVSRKRTVIDVPKRHYRDPRFDALHNQPSNLKDNSEKAYAFLNDYQKGEIKELKAAIKATRNEDEKETLRRKMVSMENRLKSKAAKEREREVLRKHRREEREKIEQGKQPYYLKSKDVKQKALEEKFKGMKGKDREKLMERRRKKEGQKEKKKMPMARRVER